MSALIKASADDIRLVRPLPPVEQVAAAPTESADEAELRRLRMEVEELRGLLGRQEEALGLAEEKASDAFGEGEAKGREEGLRQAEDDSAERRQALAESAARATELYASELQSMERLAALLAATALERLLGESDGRDERLYRLVRNQVQQLDDRALVRISVSEQDFPDSGALAELGASLPGRPCEIAASDRLGAGDVSLKLALGTLEVGLSQQWSALEAELLEIAEPERGR
ncbi:hypothetical protein [Allosphingosinicella sp.]|uniref:hypothetical protein n=1 Tax=Allosphingosinicella sp. TaxID=2823234 RepID=UPI002F182302